MSPGRRPTQGSRPANMSTTPAAAMRSPQTMSSLPMSLIGESMSFEQRPLAGDRGRDGFLAMDVGSRREPPARRRAHEEADLEEVGLHHLDQRLGLVVDRGGHRLDADRASLVVLDDGVDEAEIETVEPLGADPLELEGLLG